MEFSLDVFGSKIVMHELEQTVRTLTDSNEQADLSIGYVLGNVKKAEKFEFNGIDFPLHFLVSRVLILFIGIGLIILVSPLFHRFSHKERISRKKSKIIHTEKERKGRAIILVLPLQLSHQLVVPILWFLQVHRISDISTKEFTHQVHEFAFVSFQPIRRLLFSQLFAGILLLVCLVLPLIVRLVIVGNVMAANAVILGGIGVVLTLCT